MHVFELYAEPLSPLVETMKAGLPKLLRVTKIVKGLALPRGHAIIDLETTGLEPEEDEMVSFGILEGSTAEVVVRLTGTEDDLIKALEERLSKSPGIHLWAFYSSFEHGWLGTKLSPEFHSILENLEELKTTEGRLVDIVPYSFGDRSNGSKIPHLWENWVERASLGSLMAIVHHNMADIIREAILWILNENGAFYPPQGFEGEVDVTTIGEPYDPFGIGD